jgi:drug/metabolite transporter (DMT)-like permease
MDNMIKKYINYLKDNPEGYWFKRKLYGWGWVPVRWQGWLVVLVGIAFVFAGICVGEADDAPGAALLGILLMVAIILFFGFWKGEKPRWQWGIPDKKNPEQPPTT